jgi:rubrerythrin
VHECYWRCGGVLPAAATSTRTAGAELEAGQLARREGYHATRLRRTRDEMSGGERGVTAIWHCTRCPNNSRASGERSGGGLMEALSPVLVLTLAADRRGRDERGGTRQQTEMDELVRVSAFGPGGDRAAGGCVGALRSHPVGTAPA